MNQQASQTNETLLKARDLLGGHLGNRGDSFRSQAGMVECEIGGSFLPTIGEMHNLEEYNPADKLARASYSPGIPYPLSIGDSLNYSSPAACCCYEFIRSATYLKNIFARVKAAGEMEITVYACADNNKKIVLRQFHDFGSNMSEWDAGAIDLPTLPPNGYLMLALRAIGHKGAAGGFRWIGLVPEKKASLGERLYLIRTYGNKPLVTDFLTRLHGGLARRAPAILQRSVFIVYDATGEEPESLIAEKCRGMRLMELAGPNCGGGGNASLMFSLLLRLPQQAADAISEVIIIDDDAKIDVETIIRHDGFVTCRKPNIIAGAVVYKNDAPTVVQEFGGVWGKYFSKRRPSLQIRPEEDCRVLFPILPRNGLNLLKPADRARLAAPHDVDYGTFIFISFPWAIVSQIGAPFPFFLRLDDVEICLRAAEAGGKVVINPNLHAWHAATHSPVAEFYSVLHALALNAAYNWLQPEYTLETLAYRAASLARARNYMLLYAYVIAFEKYAEGPAWLMRDSVYDEYLRIRGEMARFAKSCAYVIPENVVEAQRDKVDIYDMLHNHPPLSDRENVIFYDHFQNMHYGQDASRMQPGSAEIFARALKSLAQIAANFQHLAEEWSQCVRGFDHVSFWDAILRKEGLKLQSASLEYAPLAAESEAPQDNAPFRDLADLAAAILPPDFDEEGYLAKNPDVKSAGIPAREHWLKFGQYEGRKY